jgi:membrane protease YdiL (CAAX protease family)
VTPRIFGLALGAALVLGGLGATAVRIGRLQDGELADETPWRTLAELAAAPGSTSASARLTSVTLRSGEHALFELCSRDQLAAERWLGALELAVFRLPQLELMLRVPLDRAHLRLARRGAEGACLPLGGGRIERSGRYSMDAVWPTRPPPAALRAVPLRARVLARTELTRVDRASVLAIALGVALALVTLLSTATPGPSDSLVSMLATAGAAVARSGARQALGAVMVLGVLIAITELPSLGASQTLCKGLALVLLQAGAALLLARVFWRARMLEALGLQPPARRAAWIAIAPGAALLLFASARLSLRLVPATGEAPIQSFVSWPSGMLCFAALGVLLPVGEELFFRGYLYRVALPLGSGAAFAIAWLSFVALHAQQSWGNWGGLVAVAAAGLVLTALRARSGSVLIAALAHLLYNSALSMASF